MADVNTQIYSTLGQNNQAMSPLQIIQLIGGLKQNQLMQQSLDARQGIADAYSANPNPDLSTIGQKAGYLAPQIIGQQTQNTTAQSAIAQTWQDGIQKRLGAVGSLSNPTIGDVTSALTSAAADNPTIPPGMITSRLDQAQKLANDPKALKKWALTQGITAPSAAPLTETAGPPDEEGVPQGTLGGEAIERRGGVVSGPLAGMPTGLSPRAVAAAAAAGAGSGTAQSGALGPAGNWNASITPLTKIVHLLDKVGPTGQGIGTETSNAVKNIGVGLGLLKADTTLPVEELKKYYTQNVLRNADIGSTDKMVSAFHGNPNIDLNTASASDLAKTDLALRRQTQAQALEGASIPPENYQKWAAQFNTQQDPVAYGFDLMSDDAQKKYLASLTHGSVDAKGKYQPGTYDQFKTSIGLAHRYHLLEKQNGG